MLHLGKQIQATLNITQGRVWGIIVSLCHFSTPKMVQHHTGIATASFLDNHPNKPSPADPGAEAPAWFGPLHPGPIAAKQAGPVNQECNTSPPAPAHQGLQAANTRALEQGLLQKRRTGLALIIVLRAEISFSHLACSAKLLF